MIGMGLTHLKRGDRDEALRWFKQASRTDDPMLLCDLGRIYLFLGDEGRAEPCFRRAAQGGSADAMNALGVLLKNNGRLDEAERWLRRAALRGEPDALNNLGNIAERRGDREGAAGYWRQAAEAGVPTAMCSLGMYLLTGGRRREARTWYERARVAVADHPDVQGPLQLLGAMLARGRAPAGGAASAEPGSARESPARPAGVPEPSARPVSRPPGGPGPLLDPADPGHKAERLRDAYKESGDPETLRLAIEAGRLAAGSRPPGDPSRAAVLATFGTILRLAYERDRDPRRLAEAVEMGRAAVAGASPSDPDYPGVLSDLGNALQEQFKLDTDPALLDEAAGLYRAAIQLAPPDHPKLAGLLSNLGNTLLAQGTHLGDVRLFDEAVLAGRAALRESVPGSSSCAVQQVSLASALLMRFVHSPNMVGLNEAMDLFSQALAALPPGHVGRPAVEANLAVATEILRIAGAGGGQANEPPAAGDGGGDDADGGGDEAGDTESRRQAEFVDTARSLIMTYERTGDLPKLTESMGLLRSVLAADGLNAVTRHAALHHLGTALWSLFERTGELSTLDEGVARLESAIAITEAPAEGRLSSQANLSGVLTLRALYSGQEADLQRSIELCRAVLAATPEGDPLRAGRLSSLASGLHVLGRRLWDSDLVREAIAVGRAVLADEPPDGPERAAARSSLGLHLLTWYSITGDPSSLDEAVERCRAAVALTTPDHLLYPRFQANLGHALHARYRAGRDEGDLEEAAAAAHAAVAATPAGHPNQIERALVLADILDTRYLSHRDPAMLDELIRAAEMAAAAAPEGHWQWSAAVDLLARSLAMRAIATGNAAELSTAMAKFRDIATSEQAGVSERIATAARWAVCLLAGGDQEAALDPLILAVQLLPRAARRSLLRADQERSLSVFAGLASSAAACALAVGDHELAVQLLEHGRGVLLRQALDTRGDLTALRERHPGLAAEFERLRNVLDPDPGVAGPAVPPATPPPLTAAGAGAQRRHTLAAQWDALLADIRNRPGFEGFLQPPGVAELRARCAAGPVVIVNLSEFRCDALILSAQDLKVVPLARVGLDEVTARAEAFRADVAAAWRPGAAADRVAAALGWLWDTIAEPVLDAVGFRAAPAGEAAWPRLWWVPTGPLAFLPLHAAGYHGDAGASPRTVLDRAVSSYLPTVRSLPEPGPGTGLPGHPPGPAAAPGALVVVMPSTPSAADLPLARAEAEHIATCLADADLLTGSQATRATVLAALPAHPWVHFACHAASSTRDVSAARLLLADHEDHPLTVREIARLRIARAELAYLSACDTARGPVKLADEAIHVTGAFHMVGYQHVIGTLWSVADTIAAEVARDIYTSLAVSGPDAAVTALAMHRAVRKMRDKHPGLAALWAAHVHVGP